MMCHQIWMMLRLFWTWVEPMGTNLYDVVADVGKVELMLLMKILGYTLVLPLEVEMLMID